MSPASTTRSASGYGMARGSSCSRCKSDRTRIFTALISLLLFRRVRRTRRTHVRQDLGRIHQVLGVERCLERAHEPHLNRGFVVHRFGYLQLSQSVLGADAAAMRMHAFINERVDRRLEFSEKAFGIDP